MHLIRLRGELFAMQISIDADHVASHIVIVVELVQIPVEHGKCFVLDQLLEVESTVILEDPLVERKETACKGIDWVKTDTAIQEPISGTPPSTALPAYPPDKPDETWLRWVLRSAASSFAAARCADPSEVQAQSAAATRPTRV